MILALPPKSLKSPSICQHFSFFAHSMFKPVEEYCVKCFYIEVLHCECLPMSVGVYVCVHASVHTCGEGKHRSHN